MKKIIMVFGLLFTASLVHYSCTKDNELFDDGDNRESFIGTWAATEDCHRIPHTVEISRSPDNNNQVEISNFAATGHTAVATIDGGTIYVNPQNIGGGYSVRGNGILTGEIIHWTTYNSETEGNLNECTCIYNRK